VIGAGLAWWVLPMLCQCAVRPDGSQPPGGGAAAPAPRLLGTTWSSGGWDSGSTHTPCCSEVVLDCGERRQGTERQERGRPPIWSHRSSHAATLLIAPRTGDACSWRARACSKKRFPPCPRFQRCHCSPPPLLACRSGPAAPWEHRGRSEVPPIALASRSRPATCDDLQASANGRFARVQMRQ
jgi:hypothetical protein